VSEGTVTTFVTRLHRKGRERTGKNRTNRTLQAVDIASDYGETIAITSFCKNGRFSLLIIGPLSSHFATANLEAL
jgi:hypothetical protein